MDGWMDVDVIVCVCVCVRGEGGSFLFYADWIDKWIGFDLKLMTLLQ